MQVAIEELFQSALAFQDEGNFVDAERLYRGILSRDRYHVGALHCLGLIAMETGHLSQAEALMRQSILVQPNRPDLHVNLSEALRRAGNIEGAIEALRHAIGIEPAKPQCYTNIAVILASAGRHKESVSWARQALQVDPNSAPPMLTLGQSLIELGQTEQAAAVLARAVQLDPGNESARFYYAAATGTTVPTAPASFVRRLFDGYAEAFDEHLTGRLGYRVPELLREAIERIRPTESLDILDLGCGTGLVGARFSDRARSLVGVDLSEGMLREALSRGIYQRLEQADLLPVLRSAPQSFDLILAGDVFVYVGELKDVFAAAFAALRPGGLFAFSVELHEEMNGGGGYFLRSSRRYAYSRQYIETLAERNSFAVVVSEAAALRSERDQEVRGVIYVLRCLQQ